MWPMAPLCVILYFLSCPCHCCGIQVQSSHHPALCNYPLLTRNITMVVFHTTNTEIISQHNSHWTHKNVSVNSSSDQMDPTKLSCLQVTDRQLSNQYFNKKLDSMRWFSTSVELADDTQNTPWQPRNGPVPCCCTLFALSAYHSYAPGECQIGSAKYVFLSLVTLTFDADITLARFLYRTPNCQVSSSYV